MKPKSKKQMIEAMISRSLGPSHFVSSKIGAIQHPSIIDAGGGLSRRYDPKSVTIVTGIKCIDRPVIVRSDSPVADLMLKMSRRRDCYEGLKQAKFTSFHFTYPNARVIIDVIKAADPKARCYIVDLIDTRKDIIAAQRPLSDNLKHYRYQLIQEVKSE